MRKRLQPKDMAANMFFFTALAMILTQVAGVIADIIDGIVTSRFLGEGAYSAVSLLAPFTGILSLLASFLATGSQVVCSQMIGKGQKDEASRVYSLSAAVTLGMSVLMLAGCLIFPRQLFAVCGVSIEKNPTIYPEMVHYLHGYMFGIPAMMLIQVLGPMIVMDGGKKLFSLSAGVLCVTNVIGDLLNVLVFHGGCFGMGLATAVSFIVQLLMLLTHFARREGCLRLSLKDCRIGDLAGITRAGSPTFIRKLATILRDLAINRMNLAIALSAAAVVARGVQNDLNSLMFCIGLGVGKTLLSMTGIYYGAQDKQGLKQVFLTAIRTGLLISGIAAVLCFAGARIITGLYVDDPEAAELSIFSIRCMALSLVLDTLLISFQNYLQGIENRKLVNLMNFGERFFIPVLTAFALSRFFGTWGIMASLAVSKALLTLLTLVAVWVTRKRFPRSVEDFMLLPDGFGGKDEDNLTACITSMDDVARESQRAEEFCRAHGVDENNSRLMALFVEEMAGNIISHGKGREEGGVFADYRLFASEKNICLSLRDYCDAFDPKKYYELHQEDKAEKSVGIRMVMKLAKDVRYTNTYNSNCLFIYMEQ